MRKLTSLGMVALAGCVTFQPEAISMMDCQELSHARGKLSKQQLVTAGGLGVVTVGAAILAGPLAAVSVSLASSMSPDGGAFDIRVHQAVKGCR